MAKLQIVTACKLRELETKVNHVIKNKKVKSIHYLKEKDSFLTFLLLE